MVGAGFNHQKELFYCSHWTRGIKKCFVDSLLEHQRNGTFHRDRTNCHAVLCSVFDLNPTFGTELSYSYGQRRLIKLKICFKVFRWITSLAAVEWDAGHNVISTDDYIWEQISKV
ncbi:UNVERIFIED_CONTAM: hypothetical protein Slati_1357500 [Sesamum latifolium]|uniref:Myb/SANT-like domain-containing protein n=1 Tax=Sesamum latifolium TaxID=2727402 RepID=A0AAW2XKZ1_9LAMI